MTVVFKCKVGLSLTHWILQQKSGNIQLFAIPLGYYYGNRKRFHAGIFITHFNQNEGPFLKTANLQPTCSGCRPSAPITQREENKYWWKTNWEVKSWGTTLENIGWDHLETNLTVLLELQRPVHWLGFSYASLWSPAEQLDLLTNYYVSENGARRGRRSEGTHKACPIHKNIMGFSLFWRFEPRCHYFMPNPWVTLKILPYPTDVTETIVLKQQKSSAIYDHVSRPDGK